jgi:hypothetical protein
MIPQDAQKVQTSHPPNPGAPRRAVAAGKAAASEEPEAYPLGRTVRRIRSTTSVRAAEWGGRVPVEDLNDARTKQGRRRVSARRGRAGEKEDYFSILLEEIADQLDRLFWRGSSKDETGSEIGEQAHPGLVGSQKNHGFFCLQCQRNF